MNKKHLITAMAAFVVIAGIITLPSGAYAQGTTQTGRTNFFQNLVQFISDKLGLDKNKVQSVVSEYRQQRRQTMMQNLQARVKSHLDSLVSQGKLTGEQETAVINEYNSLISKYNLNALNTMTPQQRVTQMQNAGKDLKSWAQSQGINPSLIAPGFLWAKRATGMMRFRARLHPSVSPTAVPTP